MGPWPESCPEALGGLAGSLPAAAPMLPLSAQGLWAQPPPSQRCPGSRAWHTAGALSSCHSTLGKPKVLVQGAQVLVSVSSHVTASCLRRLVPEEAAEEKAALQPDKPLTW